MTYRGETIANRIDSYYYQPKFRKLDQIVEGSRFDVFNLGMLINDISSGITPKVDGDYYTDSSGIPFLRVQNIVSPDIDLSDSKFIKREVHENLLRRSRLREGDLVFTITGRIGSVAVVPKNFEGNINQHSVRFHVKEQFLNIEIDPHYVAAFLNSNLGRSLAIKEVTGGTRPALDYKAVKSLKIIVPPPDIQNHIIKIMDAAHVQKKKKEAEASVLLNSIGSYMMEVLGIEIPTVEERECFLVSTGDIKGRIDPSAYRLLKTRSVDAIRFSKYESTPLKNAAMFRKEVVTEPLELPYVGLENIESNTGFHVPSTEEKESFNSAFKFYSGDVLFPKLRPYLNKVHLATFNGVCSTEFHVLSGNRLNNLYLVAFLRSKLVVNQATCLMTGNTHPRLQTNDVHMLLIPLPPIEIQNRIAQEVEHRLAKVEELRQAVDAIVNEAKKEAEQVMLEGVDS